MKMQKKVGGGGGGGGGAVRSGRGEGWMCTKN